MLGFRHKFFCLLGLLDAGMWSLHEPEARIICFAAFNQQLPPLSVEPISALYATPCVQSLCSKEVTSDVPHECLCLPS